MDTPDNGAGDAASRSTHGSTRYIIIIAAISILYYLSSWLFLLFCSAVGSLLGHSLRRQTDGRKLRILEVMRDDQAEYERNHKKEGGNKNVDDEDESLVLSATGTVGHNKDWDGIVGFFHPFCNAGGGGERVLWAAIRATQLRWPKAKCIVYTGDHEVTKEDILHRVRVRFNIKLHAPAVTFLYLSTRRFVLASTWPHFTLAGQSLGSIILAWDAFSLMVPDIFVDTMGYAFSQAFSKILFPNMPTGAYVHYPTISTDMLESLDPNSENGAQGVNAGQGTGIRGKVKQFYWQQFANWYSACGKCIDVVMTNSTWTQSHISKLWDPYRRSANMPNPIAVVYPPVAVREVEQEVEVSKATESVREKAILYIAQFRPEKNHQLILQAFAEFVKRGSSAANGAKLILVGSVRDDHDSKRVYKLRLLVNELHIKDQVEFHLDAPWPDILKWLRRASVGVNGMWNEHFGIGVVEYQAAGLVAVVHNSGGPKLDIVTEFDGQPTGFHASTASEFADGFEQALSLKDPQAWRVRARQSAKRFTEEEFVKKWVQQMEKLVAMKS